MLGAAECYGALCDVLRLTNGRSSLSFCERITSFYCISIFSLFVTLFLYIYF